MHDCLQLLDLPADLSLLLAATQAPFTCRQKHTMLLLVLMATVCIQKETTSVKCWQAAL